MVKERYCSYEVSKLLKEKGFDVPCSKAYMNDSMVTKSSAQLIDFNSNGYVSKPTHQMAMDWLRKEHHIYADPIKQGNYNDCSEYYSWIVARMGIIHRNSTVADKLSYEEAVEAALKYSLTELMKEVKNDKR